MNAEQSSEPPICQSAAPRSFRRIVAVPTSPPRNGGGHGTALEPSATALLSAAFDYRMPTSSTSKIKVALGGILGGLPLVPYPSAGGTVSLRTSPTCIPGIASSHP